MKGNQIDVETLGQFPSAAHADSAYNARRAQTAIAADHATDASTINGRSVGCASSSEEFAGVCWDLRVSTTAVTAFEATAACALEGGELPSGLGLTTFAKQPGVQLTTGGEWTNQVEVTNQEAYGVIVRTPDGFRPTETMEPHKLATVVAPTPHPHSHLHPREKMPPTHNHNPDNAAT